MVEGGGGTYCGRYSERPVCVRFLTFRVPWRGASAPALLPVAACLRQEGPSARGVGRVLQQRGFPSRWCDAAMQEKGGGRRPCCCHCGRREKPGGGRRDPGSSSSDVSASWHGVGCCV